MIVIPKPTAQVPADWLPLSQQETKDAIAAFKGKKAGDKVKFEFKAYGHPSLRFALNNIFFFKCAYCESYFGATQPVAIEHYRPKGEVVEEKKKLRGYYWLAATWENLYPSCTDCNSRRTHRFPDGTEVVRGKGNEFPLTNKKKRAKSPRAVLAKEGALLLDPSSSVPADDPIMHLEFLVQDESVGLVRPALIAGQESKKGKTSIWVYALDRPGLIKFRRDLARRLLFQCRATQRAFLRYQASPGDHALKLEYEENLLEIRGFLDSDKPYVGMVRQLIARHFPGFQP